MSRIVTALAVAVFLQTSFADDLKSQSFEGSGTWAYTPDPASFNVPAETDLWGITNAVETITAAADGSFFWGAQDIDCPSSGDEPRADLVFDSVDVSGEGELTLSFSYFSVGYDSSDWLAYELVVDGVTNQVDLEKDTQAWTLVTETIPASASTVSLTLQFNQNGNSDYAAFDDIALGTMVIPYIGITSPADGSEYSSATESFVLSGTATNLTGSLSWTNEAAAAGGTLPVSNVWNISSIPLVSGENTVSVSGSNTAGNVVSDEISVIRQRDFDMSHLGDIAFTAFYSDRDAFAFVTLVDLPTNTTIFFTDEEWGGWDFVSETSEADIEWNSGASEVAAGTVVVFDYVDSTSTWTVNVGSIESSEGMGLSQSGEDIYAYYGSARLPTAFIAAISSGTPNIDNTGLIDGASAIIISDTPAGQEYSASRTSQTSFDAYLPMINVASNWSELLSAPSSTAFSTNGVDWTPALTITTPTNSTAVPYDIATIHVAVSGSNLEGELLFISETLGTTQQTAAASAYMALAEGSNILTVSGTNLYGEAASDSITVVRGSAPDSHIALAAVSTIALDGAEIVAYDETTATAFVTSPDSGLQLVDLSDPAQPVYSKSVLTNELINSVAVHTGLVAVAVESGTNTAGSVVFLDSDGTELKRVSTGILPDMVTFSPDGQYVMTADEAETADHEDWGAGSISVIDLSSGVGSAVATVLDFSAFDSLTNELVAAGVRLFPGRLPSVDFEPEYIAVSPDSTTAFVTLQENNAFAVVDLSVPEITGIIPLGYKDWSLPGNTFDASDKDDAINMSNYPVLGMYMPDSIVSFTANGKTYYVTANEGDSRDYGDADEARVEDFTLDSEIFPDAATLQDETVLGRLKVSQVNADIDGDGLVDVLYSYGARSFSIWDETGAQVYDSADDFESYLATERPELFNVNDCDPGEFDKRSDDKGCEPEAAEVGVINGVTYAFIGLERVGGVMVYNISNPRNPSFVEFVHFDDDVAPEGLKFVSASNSLSGSPLLLVANEDSFTLTVYELALNASAATDGGTPVEWLAENGLSPADDDQDIDGDDLTVAQEYALGLNIFNADTDGDLLPDGYEVSAGLNATNAATLLTDSDGDGQSDLMEYDYGTSAASSGDFFTTQTGGESNTFRLSFDAAEGHQYVVQESAGLDTWHNGVVVEGSNQTVTVEYPAVEDSRFFRVDGAMNNGAPAAKICVISDPHYMATNLLADVNNIGFQTYLAHDRKLVAESHVIMESVLSSIIEEQPDVLLVSGDLTKDGELVSHQALSNFFAQVDAEGISVVVCPGNHDINNTNAAAYLDSNIVTSVPSITPEQFVTNYSHCGYADAVYADTNSLSFVTEPVDGLWILSIDSCLYNPTQVTAGEVSEATLSWMADVMDAASASNKTVIAMMHHGVIPHYDYQLALFPEYVVNNYADVQKTLIDGGVGAVFTGHYHANDIVRDATGSLFDIETGSTVTWPCPYRVIFTTADGVMNIDTKYIEQVEGITNFQSYAETYISDGLQIVSSNMLVYSYGVAPADAAALAPAMTESFMAHYAGDEGTPSAYTQYVIGSLTSSSNALDQLMGAAINSIWNDPAPADNNVLLNPSTGGAVSK